jgi:hypothetical protein
MSTLQLANAQLVGEAPYGDFTFSKNIKVSNTYLLTISDPSVDGSFAPALPGELLPGQYETTLKHLIGHNVDEGLYFTSSFAFTEETFRQNIIEVSFPHSPLDGREGYIANMLYQPVYNGTYGYTNALVRGITLFQKLCFNAMLRTLLKLSALQPGPTS